MISKNCSRELIWKQWKRPWKNDETNFWCHLYREFSNLRKITYRIIKHEKFNFFIEKKDTFHLRDGHCWLFGPRCVKKSKNITSKVKNNVFLHFYQKFPFLWQYSFAKFYTKKYHFFPKCLFPLSIFSVQLEMRTEQNLCYESLPNLFDGWHFAR